MEEKMVQNWASLAEYDINTAKAMLATKRYLDVAFMCQQTIEKMLKACFVKELKKTPPYTHNLIRIARELSFFKDIDESKREKIELLNSYYIESRYTEDFEELSKIVTQDKTKNLLDFTEEFYQWLKSQI